MMRAIDAIIITLGLIISNATATPVQSPQSQTPWESPLNPEPGAAEEVGIADEQNEVMHALLERYAPVIKLSAVEAFFPSSVDYMLPHYSFIEEGKTGETTTNTTLLSVQLLDHLPRAGLGQYLSISEDHNPQPWFPDAASEFLFGPAGQKGGMKRRDDGRGVVEEDVYGFWVDRGRDIVDLWYWTFYPFNLGKPVGPFGFLGNHVGDWEHLRIRTVNGTAISADYHSHNGGAFSAGTTRWSDVPKVNGRPEAFSAAGSHGLWPTPGDHVFANVLDVFRLVDITDDDGAVWDTQGHVVPVRYWNSPERRRRLWHTEDRAWLNFRGMWGNKGDEKCWWFKLVGNCQLVDAPPGPNRWFGSPPDCVTAPVSWEMSSYSFYLANETVRWAENRDVVGVQVEQVCARPRKKDDDTDDDDDDDDDDDNAERVVDYMHDDTDEEDLEIWTVNGMSPFRHQEVHKVSVTPCKGIKSAVKAYRIALCLGDGKCISTSHERKVCTYHEGKKGYRFGHAATIEDPDDWTWKLGS